jgi:hypothetical protein
VNLPLGSLEIQAPLLCKDSMVPWLGQHFQISFEESGDKLIKLNAAILIQIDGIEDLANVIIVDDAVLY